MPGLVSTLLNHAYSTPSRLVQTFLQVTEQVWQPMHLSRFSTMPICALIFMYYSRFLIFSLPFKGRAGGETGISGGTPPACRTAQACKPVRALQGGMGYRSALKPIPLLTSPLKGEEPFLNV